MPPRHGACKGFAVLRARAAPGLRRARSTVGAAASAVAGLRRRRAAFALAGGRGKPRVARLNITACCMPAALAAEAATPPPARALRRALHATDGYVLRPGRLPHAACADKASRTLRAKSWSQRGRVNAAASKN